ncbi:MAG: GAF domain-containing protein [Thermodesulfobacteriota bacterium]
MDYEELDSQVSKALNLSPGCLFVLADGVGGKLFEFVYPKKLRGNMIPVNTNSILGRAVISRRSYITNNLKKEKNLVALNFLIGMGLEPAQKVLTFPIEFGGKIIAVLELVRRGDNLTEAPDFGEEDITRLKQVISKFFSLRVADGMG